NIAGFAGLRAAVDYLQGVGMGAIHAREAELLAHLTDALDAAGGVRILGRAPEKAAVVSFLVDGAAAHDPATLLALAAAAVRSAQRCPHPLLRSYGVAATCRASVAVFDAHEGADAFVAALRRVRRLMAWCGGRGRSRAPAPGRRLAA